MVSTPVSLGGRSEEKVRTADANEVPKVSTLLELSANGTSS